VANAAVNQGDSVAVVEKGPLGGVCLNRGYIRSKMLLYHAEMLETVERAGECHIDAGVTEDGLCARADGR
jgi:dihydrolipoamide dehydrogenase